MTDNEKLARFQGKYYHVSDWGQTNCKYCGRTNDPRYFDFDSINPDYLNGDAAIMNLLDTLVEKGYTYQLLESFRALPDTKVQHRLRFGKQGKENLCGMVAIGGLKPTRREAVVAAVLQLIPDKP